jgi:hypothetical protein
MAVVFLIYDSFENANMAWVEMVRRRRRKISYSGEAGTITKYLGLLRLPARGVAGHSMECGQGGLPISLGH